MIGNGWGTNMVGMPSYTMMLLHAILVTQKKIDVVIGIIHLNILHVNFPKTQYFPDL